MKACLPYVLLLLLVLLPARLMHAQWVRTSPLPYTYSLQSLAVRDTELYVGAGWLCLTRDGGTTWSVLGDSGLGNHSFEGLLVTDSAIFVGNSWGVSRTTNQGLSWDRMNTGLVYPPSIPGVPSVYGGFVLSSSGLWAGTNAGVFRSTNEGDSWTSLNSGIPVATGEGSISCLLVHGDEIFAGGDGFVFRSTNYGGHWDSVATGYWYLDAFGWEKRGVFALAATGDSLFAGVYPGLFVSVKGGPWTQIGAQWMDTNAVDDLILRGRDLFISTAWSGVLVSRDLGATGRSVSNGLPKRNDGTQFTYEQVNDLAIVGDNIFAAISGHGVYKAPLSTIVSANDHRLPEIPGEMRLEQNYPNPFNPCTQIKYTVGGVRGQGPGAREAGTRGSQPASGLAGGLGTRVKLVVYDLLGREIAVLVDEETRPGTYQVTWDASDGASGIYFIKMTAGNFAATRKMLLVR